MNVLAFDTATSATAVAFRGLERRDDPAPGTRPAHAGRLLALIEEALTAGGSDWSQLERIAVGVGPGTFTGLRIGIATAQALAQSLGIPLVGVSTLASLELGAHLALGHERHVLAVIDARRGEAFVAGDGLAPSVLAPAALGAVAGERAARAALAVGDGALKFRETLEHAGLEVPADDSPLHRVCALHHLSLAVALTAVPGNTVEPQYLRQPDAALKLRS